MIYTWNSGCINEILLEIVFHSMKQNLDWKIRHYAALYFYSLVSNPDMASVFIIISVFQMVKFVVLPNMLKIR